MDGENNGKPLLKWDDLGGETHHFRKPPCIKPPEIFLLVFKKLHLQELEGLVEKIIEHSLFGFPSFFPLKNGKNVMGPLSDDMKRCFFFQV